jgi:hypothetical protein
MTISSCRCGRGCRCGLWCHIEGGSRSARGRWAGVRLRPGGAVRKAGPGERRSRRHHHPTGTTALGHGIHDYERQDRRDRRPRRSRAPWPDRPDSSRRLTANPSRQHPLRNTGYRSSSRRPHCGHDAAVRLSSVNDGQLVHIAAGWMGLSAWLGRHTFEPAVHIFDIAAATQGWRRPQLPGLEPTPRPRIGATVGTGDLCSARWPTAAPCPEACASGRRRNQWLLSDADLWSSPANQPHPSDRSLICAGRSLTGPPPPSGSQLVSCRHATGGRPSAESARAAAARRWRGNDRRAHARSMPSR